MLDQEKCRALMELWRNRFSKVLWDCGNDVAPGVDEVEEWREWHDKEMTIDQKRIEDYLAQIRLKGFTILHVGIGNSKLAGRFSARAKHIIGMTISENERAHGQRLRPDNYETYLHNKYASGPVACSVRSFSTIVNNNPTIYCCYWRRFGIMMPYYKAKLGPGGVLLTDEKGLGWIVSAPGADPRWKFTYADWKAVGSMFDFRATYMDGPVYALRATTPKLLLSWLQ